MHSKRIKAHKERIHIEIRPGVKCPVRIIEVHIRSNCEHTAVSQILHERSAHPVPRKDRFPDVEEAVRPAAFDLVLKNFPCLRKEDAPDACLLTSEDIALPCIPDVKKIMRGDRHLRRRLKKKSSVIFQLTVLTGNEYLLIPRNPAFCKDLPDRFLLQIHIRDEYDPFSYRLRKFEEFAPAPAGTAEPDLKFFLKLSDPVCRLPSDPEVLRDKAIDLSQGDILPPVLRAVIFPGERLPLSPDLIEGDKRPQKLLRFRIQEHKYIRRIIEWPYDERIKNVKANTGRLTFTNLFLYIVKTTVPGSPYALKIVIIRKIFGLTVRLYLLSYFLTATFLQWLLRLIRSLSTFEFVKDLCSLPRFLSLKDAFSQPPPHPCVVGAAAQKTGLHLIRSPCSCRFRIHVSRSPGSCRFRVRLDGSSALFGMRVRIMRNTASFKI